MSILYLQMPMYVVVVDWGEIGVDEGYWVAVF